MIRDEKGRFVKGESGNPNGRSKREVEEEYAQAARDAVSLADWKAIVVKAVSKAKQGDDKARNFVARLFGLDKQSVEVSGPDGSLLAFALRWPDASE